MITTLLVATLLTPIIPSAGDFAYKIGDQEFLGYVAKAKGFNKKSKVVYVVQDWNGLDKHEKDVADHLAKEGFTAFAIDVYGKGVRPSGVQACSAESGKYYQDSALYMDRLTGAMKAFGQAFANSGKKVAIGYCFGGTGVLELARRNLGVEGVVSFHGGLKRLGKTSAKKINANVVVLHGAEDPFIPKADLDECVSEMKVARSFVFKSYPGAVHAFTVPSMGFSVKGAAYNEAADRASWQELLTFLRK
jgi:dienelactone hydrolase